MTGLVLLADPPDAEHLRLVFQLKGGRAKRILFWDQRGLGVARLLSAEQFLRCYGPSPAGTGRADNHRGRRCASGLGPAAGRSRWPCWTSTPWRALATSTPPKSCTWPAFTPPCPAAGFVAAQWSKLHAAIGEVLRAAIRHQGSTLRDGTYRIARNRNGRLPGLPSRLPACGRKMPPLRRGPNRAGGASPAVDVLLSGVPTPLQFSPEAVNWSETYRGNHEENTNDQKEVAAWGRWGRV